MSNMIFDPLEEFNTKYKDLHADNTNKFFEELVERSGVDPEENRKTVQQYNELKENLLGFWMPRCLDRENGGYFNCFTNDGSRPENTVIEGGGLGSLRRKAESIGAAMQVLSQPEFALIITGRKGC